MAAPVLETKLHVPRRRRSLVERPRLTGRLSHVWESALTLVSAPAGFGKTTLLAEWLGGTAVAGRSVAWLSLDPRDNDPARFWAYLLEALDRAVPGIGADARAVLESAQPSTEAVLSTLLNSLDDVRGDLALVLDDYHLVETRDVHEGVAFLLEHLPRQVHVVITGRADPPLPLARLRARGELLEVRAADLRFTADEAAAYLTEAMGLSLTAGDVGALEGRTEGWIAALQLAALSMQGRDDVGGFIAGFAGDDRYIVDYLVEEVLQRQSEDVRTFLLRTSVLTGLTGPLCEAVTGQAGGRATLEALDRGNLFVVPLDDRRQWYRYHHLFGDVLRARLLDEQPEHVPHLHRRASDWHAQHGDLPEAIRHATAAQDHERAADLIELAMPGTRQMRQEATLRAWLEALPDDVLRRRPTLTVGYAGVLLVHGELDGVEDLLREAERRLDVLEQQGPGQQVSDQHGSDPLLSSIALYRAAQARLRGDVPGTVVHAQETLRLVAPDDHLGRGAAEGLLGLAHWTSGDLDAGHRWWAASLVDLERAGHLSDLSGCALALGDIRVAQGRLHDAEHTYQHVLRALTPPSGPPLRGAADMHVGLADVLRERGDLPAAHEHLRRSAELGEHAGLPQNRYRRRMVLARVRQAEGDLDGALALADEAQGVYVADMFPDVRPVAAARARLLTAQGRWAEALAWAQERDLSADGDLSYLREFEHLSLARVLLARHAAEGDDRHLRAATGLLGRLLDAADAGGRTGSVLDVLVLQSLAHQAGGDLPAALSALQRALALAEPEGHARTFLDEGAALTTLLRAAAQQGVARDQARRLLAVASGTPAKPAVGHGAVDPLSDRELDVLRLLATDLSGPEIARTLVVSLHTVRSHTKSIFAKLGVNSRRAAVRRAGELDLLGRSRDR
jgi:LuxR family maltose regulon positive regulatory protein